MAWNPLDPRDIDPRSDDGPDLPDPSDLAPTTQTEPIPLGPNDDPWSS